MNLDLFRALFPKWNFFDQVGAHFFLEYRGSEEEPWIRVQFEGVRKKRSLLINPDANFLLAETHIIEQFAINPENKSSVKLVQSLLKTKISLTKKVQFRLIALTRADEKILYQSDWLQVDSL